LIRLTGDWMLAEDATQDAFAAALSRWPTDGVPDRPAAWLTTVARNRAIDRLRSKQIARSKQPLMRIEAEAMHTPRVDDDRLSLIFTCCHPALPLPARVALTLRTVAGLAVADIAAAFLVPETTMAQRLVRARRKIEHAGIPYRVPPAELLQERLDGVLAVLYLAFNVGYTDISQREVASTAVALSQALVDLMPGESEARGLSALLLLQHSRRASRVDESGALLTLEEQDRGSWHTADIATGRLMLLSASGRGPYVLQASIALCHAAATTPAATDWSRIVALYDELHDVSPSPIVAFNRAIAVGMCDGPDAGLRLLDELEPQLTRFRLLPAARADLLRRSGRRAEAAAHYRQAIESAATDADRMQLERRLAGL
jgi:RNA polymerase sigma-70 factor (ECF subfamily)